ncbi:MAG TPA: hypothetical protein VHZ73_08810 [Vicinamibacterales bacterium]|nr:hypothetical protein [Vicinamibacterales bacterium]
MTLLVAGSPAFAGDVRVSMHDGRVNLSARDATLKEILDAWSQAGRTSFTHLDGVTVADRITLELTGVKEEDALAVLLRPLSGYITVKRTPTMTSASEFDRVVLVPTSVANHDSTVINAAPPAPFQPPPGPPPQTVIVNGVSRIIGANGALVDDDQIDAPRPPQAPPQGFSRGDAVPTAPGQARPAPAAPPAAGSSLPGVVNPPPAPAPSTLPAQR